MNPKSESAWWIVSYTIALIGRSDDPPREPAIKVLRKAIPVRCEHWREAFNKGRRIALDEVGGLNSTNCSDDGYSVWQFMGINQLIPLPSIPKEGDVLGSIDCSYQSKPLCDLFRETIEDYQMECSFDERRAGQYYRAIVDNNSAGF
jgi:hypothetical protein